MVRVQLKNFDFDSFLPEFRLTRPAEMFANPSHDRPDPATLNRPALDRFPFQKPMPAYHPQFEKEIRLQHIRKNITQLLQTDRRFHLLHRERAVELNTKDRIADRIQEERIQFELHGEKWVEHEYLRRAIFYKKVADIIVARRTRHEKARAFQLAAFHFLRARGQARALKEHDRLEYLIHRAIERAKATMEFRTEDLYVKNGTHGFVRLKVHGQPSEAIVGDLHWDLAKLVTEMNQQWRLDDLRVTLPNGSFGHTGIGGGQLVEKVTADLQLPIIRERSRKHDFWHNTGFVIETPNHSLMHANKQGQMPEAAQASLSLPQKQLKTLQFRYWHDRNFLIETANHSLQPATRQGNKPEAAIAHLQAPHKREVTHRHDDWHAGHMFAPTPNGSFAPLKGHGKLIEHVAADIADVPKREITHNFDHWHEAHYYKQTPNGGMAPLLNSGRTIEFVSGQFTHQKKSAVTQHHLEHRLADLFVPTENGTWRRLARSGKSVEHVSADVAEQVKIDEKQQEELAAQKRIQAARKSLREIHKNLAAHEPQRSLLQDHAVKPAPVQVAKAPPSHAPDPVPEAKAANPMATQKKAS